MQFYFFQSLNVINIGQRKKKTMINLFGMMLVCLLNLYLKLIMDFMCTVF